MRRTIGAWLKTVSRLVAAVFALLFVTAQTPQTVESSPLAPAAATMRLQVATVLKVVEKASDRSHLPVLPVVIDLSFGRGIVLADRRTGRGPAPRAPPIT